MPGSVHLAEPTSLRERVPRESSSAHAIVVKTLRMAHIRALRSTRPVTFLMR